MKKRKLVRLIRRMVMIPVFMLFGIIVIAIPTVPIVLITKTIITLIVGGSPTMWIFLSLVSLVISSIISAIICDILSIEFSLKG